MVSHSLNFQGVRSQYTGLPNPTQLYQTLGVHLSKPFSPILGEKRDASHSLSKEIPSLYKSPTTRPMYTLITDKGSES